jgi:hypothetical protein
LQDAHWIHDLKSRQYRNTMAIENIGKKEGGGTKDGYFMNGINT